jgi:diguanylate cyclase (GGDEF)-like protein/PAS domain S-box-containing protein
VRRGEPLTGLVVGLVRGEGDITWLSINTGFLRRPGESEHYGVVSTISDISHRRRDELNLRNSEGRFRSLTHLSSDWFWEQDAEYRFTLVEGRNVAGGDAALRERLLGTTRWESGLEVEGGWDAHRAALEAREPFHDILMWRTRSDGGARFVRVSGEPTFGADGRFTGYRGVGRDVTEEKRAEQVLRLEHAVSKMLSEASSAHAGLAEMMRLFCEAESWSCCRYFAVDRAADMLVYRQGWSSAEPAFVQLVQESDGVTYRRGEGLIGLAWQSGEPIWSTDTSADPRSREKSLLGGAARGAFLFGVAAEGEVLGVLSFTSRSVRQPDERLLAAARVIGAQVGQFVRRISAEASLRESESRFRSLAYRDALTGLDNRTSLFPALEKAVERSRRRASRLAGLFLDFDGFKEVNDAHGHDAGDRLLVEAARRLKAALRSGDPVARLGGDEFFVVLEDIQDSNPAERVAKKLLGALAEPYDVGGGNTVSISASIGISVFPDDAGDAATLLKHADAAMYAAKQAGKNDFRFFKSAPAANDGREDVQSEKAG